MIKKNYMIISIDAEKIWQDSTPSYDLKKQLGIEENYLNIIKPMYDMPVANILNGEAWEAFWLGLGTRQGYPLSPPPFNTGLEFLARAVRQEKK